MASRILVWTFTKAGNTVRRIYFLVPDLETTHKIVDELKRAAIEERFIHVVAREGTPLADIPEATMLEKTDFVPGLEKGVALGGVTGLMAGLVAVSFPVPGIALGGGAVLMLSLLGAGIAAWFAGMVGSDVPRPRVEAFEEAVKKGELLMLVDVPKDRVVEIEELVKKHHPEAKCEGTEATLPVTLG